ncbi:MAG: site-2 protease family protein [Candidatus Hydrogenedentota bacterium]
MLFSIAVFILVLGLLIFFHEFGHFLAAKACGIYVDRFSLGMPPRVAGIKIGETDYCVGALPIGGFVKMAGQEDAPMSDEEREQEYGGVPEHRWFNKKPVWQRFIVVLAGPFMNLVLAVLLYGWLAAMGPEVPEYEVEARIGQVEEDMPAASAPLYRVPDNGAPPPTEGTPDAVGWETGDRVLAVNGEPVDSFNDLVFSALLGGERQTHRVMLARETADGETVRYVSAVSPATPEEEQHPRFGVSHFATPVVGDLLEAMPAAEAGLEKGDVIREANGAIVDRAAFIELVEDTPEGDPIDLVIERDGETFPVTITPETIGRVRGLAFGVDSRDEADREREPAEIFAVTEEIEEENTGIQRKDRIVAVNGEPVSAAALEERVRKSPGETLEVTVERPEILFGMVQKSQRKTFDIPVDPVRAIGVTFTPRTIVRDIPPSQILPEALEQSYEALALVVGTIKALVARDVSPANLGGPIMIASVTTKAAEEGLPWLLRITAFISINLCVFNLLPLPVLDGGLLVLNAIEGIRRKPLSRKIQERFQMVGFFLIIFLMVFVTYHDIRRWFESLIP